MSFGTRSEVCIILFTHFSPFYLLYFLISICSSVWSFLSLYVNSTFVAESLNVLFNVSFISSFSFLICFCKSIWFFFKFCINFKDQSLLVPLSFLCCVYLFHSLFSVFSHFWICFFEKWFFEGLSMSLSFISLFISFFICFVYLSVIFVYMSISIPYSFLSYFLRFSLSS